MKKLVGLITWFLLVGLIPTMSQAAGILTPIGSGHQPIQIRDHHVNVVINNGFSMTEVHQTFYNANSEDLEAIYSFPLPKSASLSEVTLYVGEREIQGEVLEKQKARQIYADEKSRGLPKKMSFIPLSSKFIRCLPMMKPKFDSSTINPLTSIAESAVIFIHWKTAAPTKPA